MANKRILVLCLHVAQKLVSCVATRQRHMGNVALTQATVFMTHLGTGMATWLVQPLTILWALDRQVRLVLRMTHPATCSNSHQRVM